jgi:rhamnose transport system ATP-binding protein
MEAVSCLLGLMVLELEGMQKRFGGVVALRQGDLRAAAGEVHLLLGENGAGKSTLMKIAAGMVAPDGGRMRWRGAAARFRTPSEAQRAGVAMVHQESLLAPHLTVAENLWLGRELAGRWGWLRRGRMREAARRLIAEHRFPLREDWRVERLSPAERQMVEICRAVAHEASLLIFDEPTSALSDSETREVFRIVGGLKDRGVAVVYITHRMEELRAVGDRATVLRDGETVFTAAMAEVTNGELVRQMVGRELEAPPGRERQPGAVRLRVDGLTRHGALQNISFEVRAGEILGIAGLVGAGRTELCRALFGVDIPDAGRVEVDGVEVRARSPREAVEAGLALAPEDRQRAGLATGRPVGENLLLASLERVCRWGFVDRAKASAVVQRLTGRMRLKAASPAQAAGQLSGGNQQKVVVAKWVARGAKVYLFDEPTRGIDIGAKAEVFGLMEELAREGAAVVMVSSEMPELLQMADRILVMRQGRVAAELPRTATQEEILRHAALESA